MPWDDLDGSGDDLNVVGFEVLVDVRLVVVDGVILLDVVVLGVVVVVSGRVGLGVRLVVVVVVIGGNGLGSRVLINGV